MKINFLFKKHLSIVLGGATLLPFIISSASCGHNENKKNNDDANESIILSTIKKEKNETDKSYKKRLSQNQINIEKYNQVNILSDIHKYFQENDHSNLISYLEGGSPESVEYKNMMKNNYMHKYIKFDTNAFKTILKEKLGYTDELIKRIKISYDYNNVRRDAGNWFDVIFPVKLNLLLKSHDRANYVKGLMSEHIINFRIKNVKMSKKESDILQVIKQPFEELKNLNSTNFKIGFNINNDMKALIDKYGIHNLDSKNVSKMVTLQSEKYQEIVNKYQANKNIHFKATVFDIDWSNDEDLAKATAKVRLAVSNYDEKLGSLADVGFTLNIAFDFDKNNDYLKVLKLSESIDVHIISNIETNTDLSKLTLKNLFIKIKNSNIKKVEVAQIKPYENDFRNADVVLNVYLNNGEKVTVNKHLGVGSYSYIYEQNFTKENIQAPNFGVERITQENLKSIDTTFLNTYNSKLFTGGYATSRGFYGAKTSVPRYVHVGEDYVAPEFSKIVMPYDGEIVEVYELETRGVGTGVGTVILLKIPVANLDWSPKEKEVYLNGNDKHIYMSFLHLDAAKTMNNHILGWAPQKGLHGSRNVSYVPSVSPQQPKKIKKNDVIGFIGSPDTNGGWMSHVHVNLFTNREAFLSPNYFSSKISEIGSKGTIRPSVNDNRVNSYVDVKKPNKINPTGNIGVATTSAKEKVYKVDPITGEELKDQDNKTIEIKDETIKYLNNINMAKYERKDGYADPNLVYKLRDPRSLTFSIEDLYDLNKTE